MTTNARYAMLKSDTAARAKWLSEGLTPRLKTRRGSPRVFASLTMRIKLAEYTLTAASARIGLVSTMGRPGNGAEPLIPSQFRVLETHGMEANDGWMSNVIISTRKSTATTMWRTRVPRMSAMATLSASQP